jgi:hypothetical protein
LTAGIRREDSAALTDILIVKVPIGVCRIMFLGFFIGIIENGVMGFHERSGQA